MDEAELVVAVPLFILTFSVAPALGREGPDAVFVINRGVRAAVQHLAVIAGEFVVGLCLFKVRVAQQDIALQAVLAFI